MSSVGKDHAALHKELAQVIGIVSYEPIGDEPNCDEYLKSIHLALPTYRTRPNTTETPEQALTNALQLIGSGRGAIFLPGREFDTSGTRHGRGGGWYDRFLSIAPRTWLKIGVASDSHLSPKKLERKPWDEPVEYLLVKKSDVWDVYDVRG